MMTLYLLDILLCMFQNIEVSLFCFQKYLLHTCMMLVFGCTPTISRRGWDLPVLVAVCFCALMIGGVQIFEWEFAVHSM